MLEKIRHVIDNYISPAGGIEISLEEKLRREFHEAKKAGNKDRTRAIRGVAKEISEGLGTRIKIDLREEEVNYSEEGKQRFERLDTQDKREDGASLLRGVFRTARQIALFSMGIAATSIYSNTLAKSPNTLWERSFSTQVRRIEQSEENGNEEYALAYGASLTSFNFIEGEFEKTTAKKGRKIKVYNLGVPAAQGHEVDYYLRKTLGELEKNKLPLPRFILFDLTLPFSGITREDGKGTIRNTQWHNLYETISAIEASIDSKGSLDEKVRRVESHLKAMIKKYVPIGKAYQDIFKNISDQEAVAGPQVYYGEEPKIDEQEFNELKRGKVDYLENKKGDDEFPLNTMKNQAEYLLRKGIIPIFYIPPCLDKSVPPEVRPKIPLIMFDDPRVNQNYWEVESRHDLWHLKSGEPSKKFTCDLAEEAYEKVFSNTQEYERKLAGMMNLNQPN